MHAVAQTLTVKWDNELSTCCKNESSGLLVPWDSRVSQEAALFFEV